MARRSIGPGDDVDAWCTRCRMNLNHRVIAVVGKTIERVHCLTCGGDHKYYPPKNLGAPEKEPPPASPKSKPRTTEKSRTKAYGEWMAVMKELPEGSVPRQYRISDSYGPAEFIEHPVFGAGRVMDILGAERISVIFKDGRKILVCNKAATS